ncbi:MAG: aldo/keto reductase [Firmicutes bacterium]|nr:aldo/keto reductase [Bacillota bacterium]
MEYRSLGRTGVQVSALCLGTMMFGRKTDQAEATRMVDRFLDAGGNFIDTANVYQRGVSEEMTGQALSGGKRHRVILATKVHGRMDDQDPNAWGNHRRNIIQACEASLKRLKTDYIDLYQIHRPQSSVPIDETLRALDDLIRAGKVRYIGTSTFAAWQLMESIAVAKELGLNRFISEQPPYHLLDRRIERELIPFCQTYGLAVLPWSPLAGGKLTGKYRRGAPAPEGSREDPTKFSPGTWSVLEQLEAWAQRKECTPTAFALAWVMAQPGVTSPIIGPKSVAQLEENLAALNVTITEEDRRAVDSWIAPGTHTEDYYRADFGPHPYR